METFLATMSHVLRNFLTQNPYFHNGGNILRLTRLMNANRVLFDDTLQRVANTFTNPFTKDVWEKAIRQFAALQPAADFSRLLQENRNKVAERFFDGAGSLHVVLFDPDERHWQNALPAASAAVYADLAQTAQSHHALPSNTDSSVFLHILVTQKECLFTNVPIPDTPSETTEDSDHSGPQQMDVDAEEPDPETNSDEIPEGSNQLRFLQRHNAGSDGSLPWAGLVE
jgi:hypothetical protein